MLRVFKELYTLKLKEKPDPRSKEVFETMEMILSTIPAESSTFPFIYQNRYLGDAGAIALCETLKGKCMHRTFKKKRKLQADKSFFF